MLKGFYIKNLCSNIVATMKKTKDCVIRIRVTEEFKKEIERKANEMNISVSAYVRIKLS